MLLRQGGLSVRVVAEPQPIWLLVQVAPEDRAQQPAGDDIVCAVARGMKALCPGPLVGGKRLRQGLDLRGHHVKTCTPDVDLVASEPKGLRRRAPQGRRRPHGLELRTARSTTTPPVTRSSSAGVMGKSAWGVPAAA